MELHELGFSISYDRVLQLESKLATAVCDDIDKKGIVCPTQLRKGLFSVGALDNLDHTPQRRIHSMVPVLVYFTDQIWELCKMS